MVWRIILTALFAILSAAAFWCERWAEKSDHSMFAVMGVAAAMVAAVVWFRWETIRAGWNSGDALEKGGAKLPVLAWSWPLYITGIYNLRRPARDAADDRASHSR